MVGWTAMWATLDKFFVSTHDHARRIAEYRRVKQGNRPHHEYFTEWDSKRHAANIKDDDAATLLADYMGGINPKLRDHVRGHVDASERDWNGYVALIMRMAEGWEAHHSYGGSSNSNSNSSSSSSYGNSSRNGSGYGGNRHHNRNRNNDDDNRTVMQGGNKMDLDPTGVWTGRRAKWADEREIQRRRDNQLCLRCGGTGHIIRNCPLLPPERPGMANGNKSMMATGRVPFSIPNDAWEEAGSAVKE
jgi:hypothetical protein